MPPTTFLTFSPKIGGQTNNNKTSTSQYLTKEQTNHVYKKTEVGEIISTETLHQQIEQERQLHRIDDTNGYTSPYKELIVNSTER